MRSGIWEGIFLGLVQGLTEFLPVSSSGHLVLTEHLLGVHEPGVVLEVVLHLGTLLAVLTYYRADLLHLGRGFVRCILSRGREGGSEARYLGLLALGTLPALAAGLALRPQVEASFQSPRLAAAFLVVTGLLLVASRWFPRGKEAIQAPRAFLVGLFQATALLPGISRSGATISAGLLGRVGPQEAARFSFLLSIPAILGATAVTLPDLAGQSPQGGWELHVAGFAVAAVSGYAAICGLLRALRRGHLAPFGIYCLVVGGLGWALL